MSSKPIDHMTDDELMFAANAEQAKIDQQLREQSQLSAPAGEFEDEFANLSDEQLEAEIRKDAAEKAAKEIERRQFEAARTFTAERPDFVTNQRNAQKMASYLEAAGLDATNVDSYHEAAKVLQSRNLLQLDSRKLPPTPRRIVTQNDLENMPIEDLADLVRQESRQPGSVRRA